MRSILEEISEPILAENILRLSKTKRGNYLVAFLFSAPFIFLTIGFAAAYLMGGILFGLCSLGLVGPIVYNSLWQGRMIPSGKKVILPNIVDILAGIDENEFIPTEMAERIAEGLVFDRNKIPPQFHFYTPDLSDAKFFLESTQELIRKKYSPSFLLQFAGLHFCFVIIGLVIAFSTPWWAILLSPPIILVLYRAIVFFRAARYKYRAYKPYFVEWVNNPRFHVSDNVSRTVQGSASGTNYTEKSSLVQPVSSKKNRFKIILQVIALILMCLCIFAIGMMSG